MTAQNSSDSTAGKGELTQEQEWIAQGETPQERERRATELSLGRIRAMINNWQEHERPKSLPDIEGTNIFIRLWRCLIGPDWPVWLTLLGVVLGCALLARYGPSLN